ncbi:MAG: hypothetical protein QW561_02520 [Candidatus Aenigmatarchaeota archaeon]
MKIWHSKWNPLGNYDEPEPPADKWKNCWKWLRHLLWFLRNPLHNFTFYWIGFVDKRFVSIGYLPKDVFAPRGYNVALRVYKNIPFPFISYSGERLKWYLGWRERGNWGAKITLSKKVCRG